MEFIVLEELLNFQGLDGEAIVVIEWRGKGFDICFICLDLRFFFLAAIADVL